METQRLDNEVIVSVGSVKAVFAARSATGEEVPLSSAGAVPLSGGGSIQVRVEGLAPESDAEGLLYSEPVRLGTGAANDAGRLEHSYVIPQDVPSGQHRFVLRLEDAANQSVDLALGVVTVDDGSGVGVTAIVLAVLGLGSLAALFLPAALRRRREPGTF